MRWIENPDRRPLVGDAVAADLRRLRPVLRLVELELVVLNDDDPALRGVVEQPVVVRAQVGAPLVRAHAGDDDVESGEIAPGQIVGVEKLDGRAELLDRLRHRVADAPHVPDRQVLARA